MVSVILLGFNYSVKILKFQNVVVTMQHPVVLFVIKQLDNVLVQKIAVVQLVVNVVKDFINSQTVKVNK